MAYCLHLPCAGIKKPEKYNIFARFLLRKSPNQTKASPSLMRKNAWFISLLVTLAVASCTTRKDGFAYRVFHNTTARYNGYFYARLAMQEADLTLNAVHKDDYDVVLPLFVYGEEKDAEQIFPLMERAIEKSSRVIERHKMEPMGSSKKARKRPEMNKWIDDNYLLIGVAYFYKRNYPKAEEMFLYVSRKYKEPDMQALSNAWLTRVYMQRDQIGKLICSSAKRIGKTLQHKLNTPFATSNANAIKHDQPSFWHNFCNSKTSRKRPLRCTMPCSS